MNDDAARWRRVKAVLMRALDVEPQARAALLDAECGGDGSLRRDVDSLLANLRSAGDFIEQPAIRAVEAESRDTDRDVRDAFTLQPDATVGPYRIVSCIGRGGMGEVYRARDARLDRDVAIKVLLRASSDQRERLDRFLREARVLAALNHPNIGAVYGLEQTADGQPALVLELVEGVTLADRLDEGPLPVPEVLRIAGQIANALEASHGKGIVHRDVKPANVALQSDGTVKVLDFGLAKIAAASPVRESDSLKTATGIVVGTVAYMAPEQACGAEVDARADVWAFGCVCYEMLAGVPAFAGLALMPVLVQVLTGTPAWDALGDIPIRLRELLRRCLEKDRAVRPHSGAELRSLLEDVAREEREQQASRDGASRRPRQGRRRLGVSLVTVLLLSIGVGLILYWVLGNLTPRVDPVHRKLTFTGDVEDAVLSPDGRMLAYATADRLLVQDTSVGPAVEVRRSPQGFRLMRWSPLGDRIAVAGKTPGDLVSSPLTVVARLGGPSRSIGLPPVDAAWSPDGRQIVASYGNVLAFVDVREARTVDALPLTASSVAWHHPLDRIAAVVPTAQNRTAIWVTAPGKRNFQEVYSDERALESVCWSATGTTIYVLRLQHQSADLIAVDLGRFWNSRPRVVLAGLSPGTSISVSQDGRSLVYVRRQLRANLAMIDVAHPSAPPTWITRGTEFFESPDVSPDGASILASVAGERGRRVARISIATGEATVLTAGGEPEGAPRWSPDGKQFAFAAESAGRPAVWLVRADGTGRERVAGALASGNLLTAWSPDGRLMWQDMVAPNQMNYRILDLSTATNIPLFPPTMMGWAFSPAFAPAGDRLAVRWIPADGQRPQGIYTLSWPYRTTLALMHAGPGNPVGWLTDRPALVVGDPVGFSLISADTGKRSDLLRIQNNGADLMPDGKHLIISAIEGSGDAWLVRDFDPLAAPSL